MRRTCGMGLAAAVACVLGAADASTQQPRASLFDLGVYGGGAYTTDWYETRTASSTAGVVTENDDGEGRRIGFAPIFGANATFYGLPWVGIRLHYAYMPSDLPAGDTDPGEGRDADYFVNNHFYDLGIVFRAPALPIVSSLVSNLYVWIAGGGLTTDVAGKGPMCVPELLSEGACLPVDPDMASVGQGVVGVGGDVISLAANLGLFAELAAHMYDSPVHTGEGFVPRVTVQPGETFRVADDKYGVTTRLVAGLKFAFGGRVPEPAPAPLPPAPPPAPAPPPPPAPAMREVTVCVVEGGRLTEVRAMVDPATGDTMVDNRSFSAVHPAVSPTYAASSDWYIDGRPITLDDREYVRFGVARVITPPSQLTAVGEFNGTPVFAPAGQTAPHDVLYVPLRPGCEFQPYQLREQIRVRG